MTTLNIQPGIVATVTLNRPEVRNAFNDEVIAELTQAFTALGQDPQVRVIVLAAQGKAFCAGADLNWMRRMANYTPDDNRADAARLAEMLRVMDACPKPTIARIQGDVYAGGMGLVAVCDLAVASVEAGFCLSEVKLGLVPATISPYVVRAMGARAAQRYFLTAERFGAAQALDMGFIHAATPPEQLDAQIQTWVQALLAASPQALAQCKQLLRDVTHQPISPALIASTVEGIAQARASADGKEGVQSFLQKRKPAWVV